jgi:gamma-glutamylaminecyclotransferase
MSSQLNKLFVYGTLKKGFRNHRLLEGAKYLCDGFLSGYGMHSMGAYPAIRPSSDAPGVHGELYEITDDMLPSLDRLEGVPHLYTREVESIECPDKDYGAVGLYAYVYVFARPLHGRIMRSGEWT